MEINPDNLRMVNGQIKPINGMTEKLVTIFNSLNREDFIPEENIIEEKPIYEEIKEYLIPKEKIIESAEIILDKETLLEDISEENELSSGLEDWDIIKN